MEDEITDDTKDQQEAQEELLETQQEQLEASYPLQKQESNLFNLFWKVLRLRDSTKVSNLKKDEIGSLNISVRDAQRIAMLGGIFHHPTFGSFFADTAEIINSTSMSRDGWFSELFVSQKKFATRARKKSSLLTDSKWAMFGKKQNTQESGGPLTET